MPEKRECIGVITNLTATKNKTGKFTKYTLQPILGEWGEVIDTRSFDEMERAIDHFIEKGISYLGINGGDGTIQKVLTSWINKAGEDNIPNIIPLNGGSTNAMVRHMSYRAYNPTTALRKFMNKFKKNEVKLLEVSLLRIEYDKKPALYGITFANGTVYKFIKKYLENGKPGIRWVFREITQTIGGIALNLENYKYLVEPIEAKVYVDGKQFPSKTIKAAVITSIHEPFPGLTPFKNVKKERNQFYYIVSDLDIFTAIRNAHNLLWGLELVFYNFSGPHWMGGGDNIQIETKDGFIIDGELFDVSEPTVIDISSGVKVNFVYTR